MSRIGAALAGLLGASMDQLFQLPLCFAVGGFAARRERGDAFAMFDVIVVLVIAGCGYLLVRRARGGGKRQMTLRYLQTRIGVPNVSLWHFIWDAAWMALGVVFAYDAIMGPGRADGRGRDIGFGVGVAVTAAALSVLRLYYVLRHRRASRTRERA